MHINRPRLDDGNMYEAHERACPICRQKISSNRLYLRQAFMPTDEELNTDEISADLFDFQWEEDDNGEGRYKATRIKRSRRSRYIDDGGDLADFIGVFWPLSVRCFSLTYI
jgi:hypothetical protein